MYDTKGLELSETVQEEIKKEILDEIDECNDLCIKNDNKSELIHACWYCIDGSVKRCEETDIEWINDIAEKVDQKQIEPEKVLQTVEVKVDKKPPKEKKFRRRL